MKMHLDTQGTPHSLLPVVSCRYTVPACSLTETVQYSTVQYSTIMLTGTVTHIGFDDSCAHDVELWRLLLSAAANSRRRC
jgi:hypothetical protein